MSFTIYTPDTYTSMPWKNGMGKTIELLREESDKDDHFIWRLSKAQVTVDGDFSEFNEYDRTLVLLAGNGITLKHQHSQTHVLSEPLQIACFSGSETTAAKLHNGAIIDFNIMTRKDQCSASVHCCNSAADLVWNNHYDLTLVYSVSAVVNVSSTSHETFELPADHLLRANTIDNDITLSGGPAIAIGIVSD